LPTQCPRSRGFTLAELLIALLILGVIATFTIPKILYSSRQEQKTAVFKEIISTISSLAYTANMLRDTTYVPNHINAVKVCDTNAATQGCWTQTNSIGAESTEPGYVLHNGATVAGFNAFTGANGIIVDWNGAAGPNVRGDDQIYLHVCYDQGNGCWSYQAGYVWGHDAQDVTHYQSIFN